MKLLRCDSCGRPLPEGAVRRGEAVERGGLLVCASCLAREDEGFRLPVNVIEDNRERFEAWYASAAEAREPGDDDTDIGLETSPIGEDTDVIDPLESSRHAQATSVKPLGRADVGIGAVGPKPGVVLPSRRSSVAASAFGGPANSRSYPEYGDRVQTSKSPYMIAAVVLLAILTPAFAVALWLAIGAHAGRADYQAELERERTAALASRDEQFKTLHELHVRTLEAEKAKLQAQLAAKVGEGGVPTPTVSPANSPTVPTIPGLSDATRKALSEQERELGDRIRPRLRAITPGERMVGLTEVIRWRAVDCIPDIRPLLASEFSPERMLAAEALGKLGDRESLAALRRMSEADKVVECREVARFAIAWITGDYTQLDLARLSTPELTQLANTLSDDPSHVDALRLVVAELRRRGVNHE